MKYRTFALAVLTTLALTDLAYARCPPGEQLLWEDEYYWHCGVISSTRDVGQVLERAELLGEDWQYRKHLIEALRSLKGMRYQLSAKFDVTVAGQVSHFCTLGKCKSNDTIDCSGVAAHSQLSACIVSGICRTAFPELRQGVLGEDSDAAGIASFFYNNGAYNAGPPTPGDLIFFIDSGAPSTRHGITHVAIYLGDLPSGEKMVFHAVGKPTNKALFQNLAPNDDLLTRIAGYGNVSRLVRSLRH